MRTFYWILACLALAAGLSAAATVPAGKAAVVEMVLGKASLVAADGTTTDLAKDQALSYGDKIVSGADGRVALRLASRATARIAPNSEMTFQDPGQRKGTFLNLVKGWARFLVGNREPGEAFQVSTDNAVAAVKGTDL
ncbi:MAG TPA: FecR family protein, partial [bacterium]|nr:FecR family protein [bacterium]